MPTKKSYKVGDDVFDIPEEEVQSFLKDNPHAKEVNSFVSGKDTFDIPIGETEQFLKEVPGAQPLGQKKNSSKDSSNGSTPSVLLTPNGTKGAESFGTPSAVEVLNNLTKDFERRIQNPTQHIMNDDGSVSTHKMASSEVDGKQIAYPTIVNINGKLKELSGEDAFHYAMKTGEFKEFKTAKEAQDYAEGGYKKGTPLENYTGKPIHEFEGRSKDSLDLYNLNRKHVLGSHPELGKNPSTLPFTDEQLTSDAPTVKAWVKNDLAKRLKFQDFLVSETDKQKKLLSAIDSDPNYFDNPENLSRFEHLNARKLSKDKLPEAVQKLRDDLAFNIADIEHKNEHNKILQTAIDKNIIPVGLYNDHDVAFKKPAGVIKEVPNITDTEQKGDPKLKLPGAEIQTNKSDKVIDITGHANNTKNQYSAISISPKTKAFNDKYGTNHTDKQITGEIKIPNNEYAGIVESFKEGSTQYDKDVALFNVISDTDPANYKNAISFTEKEFQEDSKKGTPKIVTGLPYFMQMLGNQAIPIAKSVGAGAAGTIVNPVLGADAAISVGAYESGKQTAAGAFRQAYNELRQQGEHPQSAYEKALQVSKTGALGGLAEGVAGAFVPKTVTKGFGAAIVSFMKDAAMDTGIAGLSQVAQNLSAKEQGIDRTILEGTGDNMTGELIFSTSNFMASKALGAGFDAIKSKAVINSAKNDPKDVEADLSAQVEHGHLTPEEAKTGAENIAKTRETLTKIPDTFTDEQVEQAVPLVEEKQKLQADIEGKDPILSKPTKDRIAEIDEHLGAIAEDKKFYQGTKFEKETGLKNGYYTEQEVKEAEKKNSGSDNPDLQNQKIKDEQLSNSGESANKEEIEKRRKKELSERVVYDREPTADDGEFSIIGDSNNTIYRINENTGRLERFDSESGLWTKEGTHGKLEIYNAKKNGFERSKSAINAKYDVEVSAIKEPVKSQEPETVQYIEAKGSDIQDEQLKGKQYESEQMSPEAYLKETGGYESTFIDQRKVDRIKQKIKAGISLDPLTLTSKKGNNVGQEGRHRAEAAKQLGIKIIPVVRINESLNPEVKENRIKKVSDKPYWQQYSIFKDGITEGKEITSENFLKEIVANPASESINEAAQVLLRNIKKNNIKIKGVPQNTGASGLYDHNNKEIKLTPFGISFNNKEGFERMITHELTHAFTVSALEDGIKGLDKRNFEPDYKFELNEDADKANLEFSKKMLDAYEQSKELLLKKYEKDIIISGGKISSRSFKNSGAFYGLTNPAEFVAEIFTNKRFQDIIRGEKTVWQKVVGAIRDFLGFTNEQNTIVEDTVKAITEHIDGPKTPVSESKKPDSENKFANDIQDVFETGITQDEINRRSESNKKIRESKVDIKEIASSGDTTENGKIKDEQALETEAALLKDESPAGVTNGGSPAVEKPKKRGDPVSKMFNKVDIANLSPVQRVVHALVRNLNKASYIEHGKNAVLKEGREKRVSGKIDPDAFKIESGPLKLTWLNKNAPPIDQVVQSVMSEMGIEDYDEKTLINEAVSIIEDHPMASNWAKSVSEAKSEEMQKYDEEASYVQSLVESEAKDLEDAESEELASYWGGITDKFDKLTDAETDELYGQFVNFAEDEKEFFNLINEVYDKTNQGSEDKGGETTVNEAEPAKKQGETDKGEKTPNRKEGELSPAETAYFSQVKKEYPSADIKQILDKANDFAKSQERERNSIEDFADAVNELYDEVRIKRQNEKRAAVMRELEARKKDIDDAISPVPSNPKKDDEIIQGAMIPIRRAVQTVFKGLNAAQDKTIGKVVTEAEKWISQKVKQGNVSQNNALRVISTFLTSYTNGLPRSEKEVSDKRLLTGGIKKAQYDMAKHIDNLHALIGNNIESLERIHEAMDPDFYKDVQPSLNQQGWTPATFEDLTEDEKTLHNVIRKSLDYVHDYNFAMEFIDQKLYDKHKGTYTPRMYESYEVPQDVQDNIDESFTKLTSSKKLNFSIFKKRKEVTESMAETILKDPVYTMAKRLMQTEVNASVLSYLKKVSTDNLLVSREPKKGFTQLSGKGYGPLDGQYVANYIAEDLKGFFFANQAFDYMYNAFKVYDRTKLRQFYKKYRTVFDPGVQLGNFTSNFVFAFIAGIDPITYGKNLSAASKEIKNKGETYDLLLKNGIIDSDNLTRDIVPLVRSADNVKEESTPKKWLRKFDEFATRLYANTDNVAKVSAFISLKETGLTDEQAINRVYESFQNYATVGKIWDAASKTPIYGNPFVKFQADLQRILKNAALKRPLTTAMYYGIITLMSELASDWSGEDDEEKRVRENREFIPKVKFGFADVPLTFQTPAGEINLARYLSPYYIYDLGDKEQPIEAYSKMLPFKVRVDPTDIKGHESLTLSADDPLFGIWYSAMVSGKDFRGKSISDPRSTKFRASGLTDTEQALNNINYIMRAQLPYWDRAQDMYLSLTTGTDFYGRQKNGWQTLLNNLVKVQEFGDAQYARTIENKVRGLQYDIKNLTQESKDAYVSSAKEKEKKHDLLKAGIINKAAYDEFIADEEKKRVIRIAEILKKVADKQAEFNEYTTQNKRWLPTPIKE